MVIFKFLRSKLSQFMMKTNRLVLLRHGESEFNQLNKFCGWHDAPLSKGGMEDARKIAALNLLNANLEFDKVYTSTLCRAQTTTDIILREMKSSFVPVESHWRLNERHYGNLTGFNKRQMSDQYGEAQVQNWRRAFDSMPPSITPQNPYYFGIRNNPSFSDVPADQFPFAESMHMCSDRVLPVWDEIKKDMLNGKRVLVCTHGTVVRALIKHIEGLSDEAISKVNIPNCVPCVYEFDIKTGKLISPMTYLGDPEYIKAKTEQVASIGN
ncbi:phosphoglycerate mutase 2 [Scaptodrosophila lebanonensis]|uniref:Phosphoglycerate mutase n=1 Tax=Drosophila lebanonensis TaxID=7225 RepID=A0A6J2T7D0_DROLE|nr:phosphoglycerate mutase 2 [Scaptodrosophila lebanonensis]